MQVQHPPCLLYVPLVVLNDKPERVAEFESYPFRQGDGNLDAPNVGISGLLEHLKQEFLLLNKTLQGTSIQVTAGGILILESIHLVEFGFGQHTVGEVVAQQPAAEILLRC